MNTHTPGPWIVADGRSIEAQFEGESVQIASMARSSWSQPDGGKNVRLAAQTVPNSRLIAAAPDLLAALERTLNWLTSYPGEGTMGIDGPYEQARAAIAKATQS